MLELLRFAGRLSIARPFAELKANDAFPRHT